MNSSLLDLSEYNLARKTLNRSKDDSNDNLHNTDFDNYQFQAWKTAGSISSYAATSLLQWNKLKMENDKLSSDFILKDVISISADVYDKTRMREHIKKAVKQYGAVSVSFNVKRTSQIPTYWNPEINKMIDLVMLRLLLVEKMIFQFQNLEMEQHKMVDEL
ncbi:hypothetical protein [Mycoplasma phocimorsus]|uniref:hypothetical protein n=1 Tax=Mycoplasma phocimorsus TaxID=3045839 RepID=UPI0024BF937E|nr:hypothetical protein [Mycoplasma phocimorsus]MDJ1646821.1 hypothetical protein [Mycoplasma phocimorsus]